MEVPQWEWQTCSCWQAILCVLILILMEVPQWEEGKRFFKILLRSLNPYSNGSTTMGITLKNPER